MEVKHFNEEPNITMQVLMTIHLSSDADTMMQQIKEAQ